MCNIKALSLLVRKLWPKFKVFQMKVKLQGQGHKVKNHGTMWKVLSSATHMCNMKALSLLVRKLWPRLKFLSTHHTPTRTLTRTPTLSYDVSFPDIRPGLLKKYNTCIDLNMTRCFPYLVNRYSLVQLLAGQCWTTSVTITGHLPSYISQNSSTVSSLRLSTVHLWLGRP